MTSSIDAQSIVKLAGWYIYLTAESMRWVRYQEVERQVKIRNWVPFLAPFAYFPFLLNIFLITAKFAPLFIKYDLEALTAVKDEEIKFLYTLFITGLISLFVLYACIKSKLSIPNESRSHIMIHYQHSIHSCCIIMAATTALLCIFLSINLIPYSVMMEQGILTDLLLSMYSGSILLGFLASHSFYIRESAAAPFDLLFRIFIAFLASVLPAVKLALGSELFTTHQLLCMSAVFSMVLYSDFSLRMEQCITVHRYLHRKFNRPVALSLIGLQRDHSLITGDHYAPVQILSPITYNMNLGVYKPTDDINLADKLHSDFIVREAAASLNNKAIVHQSTIALYSCLSWYVRINPTSH